MILLPHDANQSRHIRESGFPVHRSATVLIDTSEYWSPAGPVIGQRFAPTRWRVTTPALPDHRTPKSE
jgi:hypothetical protein